MHSVEFASEKVPCVHTNSSSLSIFGQRLKDNASTIILQFKSRIVSLHY